MADVNDRDGKESRLVRVLAREFNRARLQLLGLIPELDDWMRDVAPEFWDDHRTKLVSGLSPQMSSVFVEQAETMMDDFEFLGVDWGLVNEAAADWARDYSYRLVTDLNRTSQRTLQKLIPQYFENQWTQGQLRDALTPSFGEKRAKTIARTEVTRAASEGEQAAALDLERQGIKMQPVWQTLNDELVCPICGPLNDKKIGVDTVDGVVIDFYPPAHPNCRCAVEYELIQE